VQVITYFDASAFVPLFINEPGSALSRHLWDASDYVVSSQLLYVETAAALAQARRLERVSVRGHAAGLRQLDELWPKLVVLGVDDEVIARAAVIARHESLRAGDAVHCASAESVKNSVLLVAAGDRRIRAACARLGMTTTDTGRA
jgi:predicted nucleic acid-binding protein